MVLAIIPARWASTRFPGKPLVDLSGKTMIQRVYEQVVQAKKVDHVVVATDDERIMEHVLSFGGSAMMTNAEHPSGTDRCAELVQHFPAAKYVINVQGDEPFLQPEQIDLLVETLIAQPTWGIATLAKQIEQSELLFNPNVVKVVFSEAAGAIYFSRNPIPFVRGTEQSNWLVGYSFFKHIGLYGFKRDTLINIASLSPTLLEKAESLEQLRWLEHGFRIAVGVTELETHGIDTPEDLANISIYTP